MSSEPGGAIGLRSSRPWRFWLIALFLFAIGVWLLSSVLVPFVAGMVIAYILDPVAGRLERAGMGRTTATLILVGSATLVVLVALVTLVPVIAGQLVGLVAAIPGYFEQLQAFAMANIERLRPALEYLGIDSDSPGSALSEHTGRVVSWLGGLLGGLWQGGLALIDIISLLAITPVVAFYLLRDWKAMIGHVDGYLPLPYRGTIRCLAGQANSTLANFMRGQALVCLILGTFYAIALTLAGLNFGLLVGFGAGLISFIPYLGSIVGLIVSVGIALVQFDSWVMWVVITGIFLFGQVVEGNFLTPKLVGESVGLHPVWVIFALMAGGSLFGFTGLLLAVPVSAVIGVLVRFLLERYRGSPYFTGDTETKAVDDDGSPSS